MAQRTTHAEINDLRRALVKAIEAATEMYLVADAGQDLPDSQLALDHYTFEVQRGITKTSFMVRAKHNEGTYPSFHFEVKVSGG
jgi:hypothetical protein